MSTMTITNLWGRVTVECDFEGCDAKWRLEAPVPPEVARPATGWVCLCPEHAHFASLTEPEPLEDPNA
jgi:hypothetical protein